MRFVFVFVTLLFLTAAKAQTVIRDRYLTDPAGGIFFHPLPLFDSSRHSKWSVSKYAGISAGYSFFTGGGASFVSIPIGLQLNRRLTDHVSAFAGVSVAPLYFTFNSAFLPADMMKTNSGAAFNKPGNSGMYSKAELGLMYTNEAKTFSISGSIGVERNRTPVFYSNSNAVRQTTLAPAHQ